MKKATKKDEWSVEPVSLPEHPLLVAELALLLQLAHRRMVDLETQLRQMPERLIR